MCTTHHIASSQAPDKRKTKNENTKLKLLHNLYRSGKLKLHKDGLITVTHVDPNGSTYQAVSIPTVFFPGLIHALHYKLNHPSKSQLTKLVARHFYTPGYQRIIDKVTEACETCLALKQLPKEIFSETTGDINGFGTNFSADIIERNQQHILIVREKLSSFTITRFIPNQTADTLREHLIAMIIEMVPHTGTVVQVDCATSWATLANEFDKNHSYLKRLNIKVDLGRHMNKNKNPVIDNACKEFHKEVLRLKPEGNKLSEIERAIITSNMNHRIRSSGHSSTEMCFKRESILNVDKPIDDQKLSNEIKERSVKKHNKPIIVEENIEVGHNVFVKHDKSKLKARELYKVIEIFQRNNEPWAIIQKHDVQFRRKQYEVKIAELVSLPGQTSDKTSSLHNENVQASQPTDTVLTNDELQRKTKPTRKAAIKARKKFAEMDMIKTSKCKQEPPLHGWDFDLMMEMWMQDDIVQTCIPPENVPNHEIIQQEDSEDSDTLEEVSSMSPTTNDSTDDTTENTGILDMRDPLSPPELPTNLFQCQNLDAQLNLPQVIQAAEEGDNSRRVSSRHRLAPSNYAEYSKSGRK